MHFRDYENGIADIVSFLLGPSIEVRRNVQLSGLLSGVSRQIDITAQGPLLDKDTALVIIDCKQWKSSVDVTHVGAFIDLVRDVGADGGVLIASSGASKASYQRAAAEQSHAVEVVPLNELARWAPTGTVTVNLSVERDRAADDAIAAIRTIGSRTRAIDTDPNSADVNLDVLRHFGTPNPTGESQAAHHRQILQALARIGIDPTIIGSGITIGGGTPMHQWVEVRRRGVGTGIKVLADKADAATSQLEIVAAQLGCSVHELSFSAPAEWTTSKIFQFPLAVTEPDPRH